MKKIIIAAAAVLAISGAGVYAYTMKANDKVVATINSTPLYESEVTEKLQELKSANILDKNFSFDTLAQTMKENIVKSIIVAKLLDTKAEEQKIQDTPEFKKIMELKKDEVKQIVFLEHQSHSATSEEKIREKYKDFASDIEKKEEVKAIHVIYENEKAAQEALLKIASGKTFEDLLKENNPDGKDNSKGGILDFFTKEQMPEAISKAAFSLAKDHVSEPVQSEFGWHILKVLEKRNLKAPSFEEVAPKIKAELYQKFVQEYVDNLLRDNKVEITVK